MNIFAFAPEALGLFQEAFETFLKKEGGDPLKREYVLPTMIDDLIRTGKLTMQVDVTYSEWFGVTYREDRDIVRTLLGGRPLR